MGAGAVLGHNARLTRLAVAARLAARSRLIRRAIRSEARISNMEVRVAEWLVAKNNGATFDEIARKAGVTRQRIHQILSAHPDYQRSQERRPPAFIEAVRKLRAEGLTAAEVGRRLGVSKDVILGVCRRHVRGKEAS
jgi:transcriptional regulator with XRE-family HTH domain